MNHRLPLAFFLRAWHFPAAEMVLLRWEAEVCDCPMCRRRRERWPLPFEVRR